MKLFLSGRDPIPFAAEAHEVFDVTGAGDTVISTLAVSLGAGADLPAAARLANAAAGFVVGHVGTTPIRISDLRESLVRSQKKVAQ